MRPQAPLPHDAIAAPTALLPLFLIAFSVLTISVALFSSVSPATPAALAASSGSPVFTSPMPLSSLSPFTCVPLLFASREIGGSGEKIRSRGRIQLYALLCG